jgi:hypothetical protein
VKLLEEKTKFSKFFLIFVLSFTLSLNHFSITRGNPIPLDDNWGSSPVSTNYDSSIIFKEEIIRTTFNSSKVNFSAYYTFKNMNTTNSSLEILLPFYTYYGDTTGPENLLLIMEGIKINYFWENISNIWEYGNYNYKAIVFNLSFMPYEEKVVNVQYCRNYMIYDSIENSEIHYSYYYLVGTARNWNHSIESAYFEFLIPKQNCDGFEWAPYIDLIGGNVISKVEENNFYYNASLRLENWTLPTRETEVHWGPDLDFIYLGWRKSKPFGLSQVELTYNIIIGSIIGIVLILTSIFAFLRLKKLKRYYFGGFERKK